MGCKPASELAKKSNTPRSTIRSILDKLCERGVIGKSLKGNTQYYFCEPPEKLVKCMERKIAQDKEAINQVKDSLHYFESVWGRKSFVPSVRTYEGVDGFIEAYNHPLYVNTKEMLAVTSYSFMDSEVFRKNDLEFFMPTRVKKGISLRVISNRNYEAMELFRTSAKYIRKHMFVPDGYEFPGTIHVYGNYIALLSSNEFESLGVIVESTVMSDMMRIFFDFMWTTCRRKDEAVDV